MFYSWRAKSGWVPVAELPQSGEGCLTLGLISAEELERLAPQLELSPSTVRQCREEARYFRSSVEVYDRYTFATLKPVEEAGEAPCGMPIAFYLCRGLFLLVHVRESDRRTEALLGAAMRRLPAAQTLERVVFAFLDGLIEGDGMRIEEMEFAFSELEERVLRGEAEEDFTGLLLRRRQELLLWHNYYEQLIDIGEALEADENRLLPGRDLRYFKVFTGRVQRLSEGVESLRKQLEHCSLAYQSMLELRLNHTMKTFTAISALFLPLTLLTGWYGMNFQYMPELHWRYGYPLVAVAALAIAVFCLGTFKKHHWL